MIHPGIMFLIVVAGMYLIGPAGTGAVKTDDSTGTVIVEKSTNPMDGYDASVSTGVIISTGMPVGKVRGKK